jgi:hypothetical protein
MTKPNPDTVKRVFMSIRLTEELREQIRERADLNERTIAAQITHYIKRGLEQDAVKKQK